LSISSIAFSFPDEEDADPAATIPSMSQTLPPRTRGAAWSSRVGESRPRENDANAREVAVDSNLTGRRSPPEPKTLNERVRLVMAQPVIIKYIDDNY
jgi:hypothetical protein